MNFAEKKQAYGQLQGQEHLEADRELLLKKSPKSPALRVGIINREKAQCEILWALLEVASVEEIVANRITPEEIYKIKFSEQFKAIQLEVTSGKFSKIELINFRDCLSNLLSAGDTPDEFKMEVHALSGFLDSEIKFHEFNEKLLVVDFLTVKQSELANIARGLKIEAPDYKLATLRPILEEYRANLPKEGAATSEEMIPVTAHLETVNELTEEKDALLEELEGKELDNEDLQQQLEETEAALEETAAELEEEKKSESSPDPV